VGYALILVPSHRGVVEALVPTGNEGGVGYLR
jgi:hypothetical protein